MKKINFNYLFIAFLALHHMNSDCVIALNDNKNISFYEQNWIQVSKLFDETVNYYSIRILREFESIENKLEINPNCVNALKRMFKNVNKEEWAAKSESLLTFIEF
jgi:hypothetical protein